MHHVEHRGTFHAVGQGLFHSGTVAWDGNHTASLRYVYDCGGACPQLAERCVQRDFDGGRRLDLLVLSHLHKDHITGLVPLLANSKPYIVVLPYLYPAERVVALWDWQQRMGGAGQGPDWYWEFLRDPAAFLTENGVAEVLMLRAGPQEPPEDDLPHTPPLTDGEPDGQRLGPPQEGRTLSGLTAMPKDRLMKIAEEEDAWGGMSVAVERLHLCELGRPLTVNRFLGTGPVWDFDFYQRPSDRHRLAAFLQSARQLLRHRQLKDILASQTDLDALAGSYRQGFGERAINNLSVVTFSGLRLTANENTETELCLSAISRCGPEPAEQAASFHRCCACSTTPGRKTGVLLTGDIDLASRRQWDALGHHLGLNAPAGANAALVYQLPHHGSRHSWHWSQLELRGCGFCGVSAGLRNRWRHPNTPVLQDVLRAGRFLMWANEATRWDYTIEFHLP